MANDNTSWYLLAGTIDEKLGSAPPHWSLDRILSCYTKYMLEVSLRTRQIRDYGIVRTIGSRPDISSLDAGPESG